MYNIVEYFDEMEILSADKANRVKTAKRMQERLIEFFLAMLADLMSGEFLHEKSTDDYREELFDLYMLMANSDDANVAAKARRFANYIQDTTENTILNAKGNEHYELAIVMGLKLLEDDIPKEVKRVLGEDRANEIALTETNWIHNYEHHQELVASGQFTHTWLSMKDKRVRQTHKIADEQTVPINQPFKVGNSLLMFPGDDSLGADIKETILCRCIEV